MSRLARQIATFPQWRAAMLRSIRDPDHKELAGWTADRAGDLGVMLLELWAYVLDVLSFYDARLAERAYLATAQETDTVAEIVSLLGYEPRPALAAAVQLALEVRGDTPVDMSARTGFRSEAFGTEPPQVFEALDAATLWPQRSAWTLAPYRLDAYDGTMRFRPGEGPARGNVVAVTLDGHARFAGTVASVDTENHPDGGRYQRITFGPDADTSQLGTGLALSRLRASVLGLRAPLTGLVDGDNRVTGNAVGTKVPVRTASGTKGRRGWVVLDAFYTQLAAGGVAALEVGGGMYAVEITAAARFDHIVTVGSAAITQTYPTSLVVFDLSDTLDAVRETLSGRDIVFHALPRPLGSLVRPAAPTRTLADVRLRPNLEPVVAALGDAPVDGLAIAVGAGQAGALVEGRVDAWPDGRGRFVPTEDSPPFPAPLPTPVRLLGNVVIAVRGETVTREVLGSGDAAQAFQSFSLKKKPLTWVADASAGRGRRPHLDVAVDGRYWTWVETLYGTGPDDRVYAVRMAPDGTATIQFGDGVTGSRLPSGVANVVAGYRFGAGAAKPPPGAIRQAARAVRDLTRVSSLPPYGGADAESADDIRHTAPDAMLSLGRAVSAADYLALARSFSGVVNASVAQRWDTSRLCMTIDVAIVADSGDPSPDLATYLRDRSVPGVPVTVSLATPVVVPQFDVSIAVKNGFVVEKVLAGVTTALLGKVTGLLAPSRLTIGGPVFHSHVVAAAHSVAGVAGVAGISLTTGPMPSAMVPGPARYFDFLTHGKVV
ncbi:baseplate J/gp47 family protein [Nocardia beijingensis]|uniref:baseplate J/gp47 family protein n=1 Tax=Nocardia beijingensis TaxID=95162 RepID=UPI000A669AC9|nr:baseplate J/gp47 family protein [Nocardia beijingensis]